MRLTVVTIGRPKDKNIQKLLDHYAQRLKHYARFEHLVLADGHKGSREEIQRQQSQLLLDAVPPRAKSVVLDERGDPWTSEKLAKKIELDALHGDSHWVLLIGGAEGHDASLRERADHLWSLSALTLPHELASLVVFEQLYRAMTILRGEPYHRAD